MPSSHDLIQALLVTGRELSTRAILFHQALVGRFGLNATDHKCLDILRNEGLVTAGRLAELTGLSTGAITATLDRLEKAGFVERTKDHKDRRKVVVRILPRAEKKLTPLFRSLGKSMAVIHAGYTAAELSTILKYQSQCVKVLADEAEKLRKQSRT